uniref:PPM-type phosphatase domain-containing protein n=1 Tax=Manihot esculenta TaxID=3983 RepID=A0A2C9UIF1_MANES
MRMRTEAERIRKCKWRVFALQDEPKEARVWLPNNDSHGLAMARAFRDFCLKDFGLISVPNVSCQLLTDKDEFRVLATDGIWGFPSNKEVVDIVASALARSSAARALVESAVRAWRYKYPTSKVADCAVLKEDDPSGPTGLGRSGTVRSGKEVLLELSAEVDSSNQDETQLESGIDWSALEGVSRINTLLTLPRFVPRKDDKKAAGEKKKTRK